MKKKRIRSVFKEIRPATSVEILVQESKIFDGKDDIRSSWILDVVFPHIVTEQPTPELASRRIGDIMKLTYLVEGKDGHKERAVIDVRLASTGLYKLSNAVAKALFFEPVSVVYRGTLRRHHRVEVPPDAGITAKISNLAQVPIGLVETYRALDLSLQGMKLLCPMRVRDGDSMILNPAGDLSSGDQILLKLFIDDEEVLWVQAAVRTKNVLNEVRYEVIHFGVEFLFVLRQDEKSKEIRRETYVEKHRRILLPYITELQRRLLKQH